MEKESFRLRIFQNKKKPHKQKTAKQIPGTCPHKHRPEKNQIFDACRFRKKKLKSYFYNFAQCFSTTGKRNVSIYRE